MAESGMMAEHDVVRRDGRQRACSVSLAFARCSSAHCKNRFFMAGSLIICSSGPMNRCLRAHSRNGINSGASCMMRQNR